MCGQRITIIGYRYLVNIKFNHANQSCWEQFEVYVNTFNNAQSIRQICTAEFSVYTGPCVLR